MPLTMSNDRCINYYFIQNVKSYTCLYEYTKCVFYIYNNYLPLGSGAEVDPESVVVVTVVVGVVDKYGVALPFRN